MNATSVTGDLKTAEAKAKSQVVYTNKDYNIQLFSFESCKRMGWRERELYS